MKYGNLFFNVILLFAINVYASLVPTRVLQGAVNENVSQSQQTTIEKQLAVLQKEKNDLEVAFQNNAKELQAARAMLSTLQERRKTIKANKSSFLSKKIALVEQIERVLAETSLLIQQIKTATVEQHIKLLEEYQDPSFRAKKAVGAVTFENLKESERRILDLQTRLSEFEKQKISSAEDLVRRKKALATIDEEYKEKERQQGDSKTDEQSDLSANEKIELVAEQRRLLGLKKDLAQWRIKDIDQKLLLIDSQIIVTREKLILAKEAHEDIKRSLKVDSQEVKKAEQSFEGKRQDYAIRRERLQEKLRSLNILLEDNKRKQDDLIIRFNVSPGDQALIRDWQKEPRTVAEWKAISNLGRLMMQEAAINAEREQQHANIELEKAKFYNDEMNLAILKSWHLMTDRGMRAEEVLVQQIKSFEVPKNELQADINTVNDKRSALINDLQKLNIVQDRIRARITALKEQETSLFRMRITDYQTLLAQLYEAEDTVRKQTANTAHLIQLYSTVLATNQETLKKIEAVVSELTAKSFWKRSTQSIDWQELRATLPDIERFLANVTNSVVALWSYEQLRNSLTTLSGSLTIGLVLLFLLRIVILIILFLFIRAFLPDVHNYLLTLGGGYGPLATASTLAVTILSFIQDHLIGVYVWGALFFLIKWGYIKNNLLAISFYFLSIPYLLWMTYRFFGYLREVNHRRNYLFMSSTYERRFMIVMQPFFYATIVIFFFREAFLLGGYPGSAVPTVLLAVNFILLQVALVSLLGKEEILRLIPSNTPLWEWIKEHVRDYYYVLWVALIAIIIMSNPYVGYGRQVFYVLSRLAITALLIPVLLWLHHRIKQISSDFFFYYEDGETMKERFISAKMFYGFLIVSLLVIFMAVGIMIAAYIWGKQTLLYDAIGLVNYELYYNIDEAGRRISVTFISLLKVVLFVIGGGILTYFINHFILKRVFDPLLIGAGVQNTIFTLIRYLGVVVALLIGMHSVGLDAVATKIAVFLGVLGFAVKEPLSDFFSYFIILVQRPIKIGDLIMVEQNVIGVVRHITPRSVIVRQRNSVTVIVPNSQITTKLIVNWSYSRSYSSFDDFFITVPYSYDAAHVRQLILKVLDENINVLKTPSPIVRLHDFVDNGYQFLIRGFLTADKVYDQWDIASEIRLDIVRVLRDHSIEIAYPTRILRVTQPGVTRGSEVIVTEQKDEK